MTGWKNVGEMDSYCYQSANTEKELVDAKQKQDQKERDQIKEQNSKDWLKTTQEKIKEEQKEDIQKFNSTIKTFNVTQKEVDKFKESLLASEVVTADHAGKFLQFLWMFKKKQRT